MLKFKNCDPLGGWVFTISQVIGMLLFGSINYAQNPIPINCTGGPLSANDDHIQSIFLYGSSYSFLDYEWPGNLPNNGPIGVEDQTAQVVKLIAGQTYNVGINLWARGESQYNSNAAIWIDFNGDGELTSDEVIHSTPPGNTTNVTGGGVAGINPTNGVYSDSWFTVPEQAFLGQVTMRAVQVGYVSTPDLPINPCSSFNWGAMIDFTVEILPLVSCPIISSCCLCPDYKIENGIVYAWMPCGEQVTWYDGSTIIQTHSSSIEIPVINLQSNEIQILEEAALQDGFRCRIPIFDDCNEDIIPIAYVENVYQQDSLMGTLNLIGLDDGTGCINNWNGQRFPGNEFTCEFINEETNLVQKKFYLHPVSLLFLDKWSCWSNYNSYGFSRYCVNSFGIIRDEFQLPKIIPILSDLQVTFLLSEGAIPNGAELIWDMGDGNFYNNLQPNAINHTYDIQGVYIVKLNINFEHLDQNQEICITWTIKAENPIEANCIPWLEAFLNNQGETIVMANQLDNGSQGGFGDLHFTINGASSIIFNCNNRGSNPVLLTVTDQSNNTATCATTVSVVDNIPPSLTCPDNITESTPFGTGGKDIDLKLSIYSDNCGGLNFSNDFNEGGENASDFYPVGETMVTFTAFDQSNNTASCSVTVTINEDPSIQANCVSTITRTLNGSNTSVTINAEELDNNSTGGTGTLQFSINGESNWTYDCSDLGENVVTLTVTDDEGATATCTTTVIIENGLGVTMTSDSSFTVCLDGNINNVVIATTSGATGIGQAEGLPDGVTASFSNTMITISGTPTMADTFEYSIPLVGGCGNVSASGTITVSPASQVGEIILSGNSSICLGELVTITLKDHVGDIQWQRRQEQIGIWIDIPEETSNTLNNEPSNTGRWEYRARVKSGTCEYIFSDISSITVIEGSSVEDLSFINGSDSICIGSPIEIRVNNHVGLIQWQRRHGEDGDWIDLENEGDDILLDTLDMAGLWQYRVMVQNNSCPSVFSEKQSVVVSEETNVGKISITPIVNQICIGSSIGIISINDFIGDRFTWQRKRNEDSEWDDIAGANISTFSENIEIAGVWQYRVRLQNGNCPTVNSDHVEIEVFDSSRVGSVVLLDDSICFGEQIQVETTQSIGNITIELESNDTGWIAYNPSDPVTIGRYALRLIAINGVCPADTSFLDTIEIIQTSVIGTLAVDTSAFCGVGKSTFTLMGSNGNIRWGKRENNSDWNPLDNDDQESLSVEFDSPGIFYVRVAVKNRQCPEKMDSIAIKVLAKPKFDNIPSDTTFCIGDTLDLNFSDFNPTSVGDGFIKLGKEDEFPIDTVLRFIADDTIFLVFIDSIAGQIGCYSDEVVLNIQMNRIERVYFSNDTLSNTSGTIERSVCRGLLQEAGIIPISDGKASILNQEGLFIDTLGQWLLLLDSGMISFEIIEHFGANLECTSRDTIKISASTGSISDNISIWRTLFSYADGDSIFVLFELEYPNFEPSDSIVWGWLIKEDNALKEVTVSSVKSLSLRLSKEAYADFDRTHLVFVDLLSRDSSCRARIFEKEITPSALIELRNQNLQEENKQLKLTVFPNPASRILQYRLSGTRGKIHIRLLDMLGQVLWKGSSDADGDTHLGEIDISSLASGTYMIQAIYDAQTKSSYVKWVKM